MAGVRTFLYGLAAAVLFVNSVAAEDTNIVLASGEWAPFTSEALYGGGSSTLILKKAFSSQSVDLEVKFMPWADVSIQAETSAKIAGWFPAYFSEERSKVCAWSDIIGTSLVGFAYLGGGGFKWTGLADLNRYKVGVVAGYVNERAFDASIARGDQKVVVSNTDVENLLNLVAKRVDAAVIDRRVMVHMIRKKDELKPHRNLIKFDLNALKEHPLYVCFTGTGKTKWAGILNQGLKATSIHSYDGNDPFMKRLKKK